MAGDTRGQMGRIQQLPPELRAYIDRRLREGVTQATIIQETRDMLAELGEPPLSAAGLNRYATKAQQAGRRIREAREAAAAWSRTFQEADSGGDIGTFTVEIIRTLAFDIAQRSDAAIDDTNEPASVEMLKDLALTLQRLERAGEMSTRRERELRREIAAQAEDVAKRKGISSDTAAALRRALTQVE